MTNNFSLLNLFTGDIMTLFVSLVLVTLSILSWAVIIEKYRVWKMVKNNPVKIKPGDNLDVIVDKLIRPFDKNLWFLSMVSYVSPFIGLFGTVWGVMDSFASIGVNQSVSIGVIAPGLATVVSFFTNKTPKLKSAYGGSINIKSAILPYFSTTNKALIKSTFVVSETDAKFFFIASMDLFELSVKITFALLKRDKYSNPNAPEPAKTSHTVILCVLSTIPFIILNNAPRAKLCVGRAPPGKNNFLPLYLPEMICNFESMY